MLYVGNLKYCKVFENNVNWSLFIEGIENYHFSPCGHPEPPTDGKADGVVNYTHFNILI